MKFKRVAAIILSGLISLSMAGQGSIFAYAKTDADDNGITVDDSSALPSDSLSPMYVEGELICLADSEEEAKGIADAYGVKLKDYSYGVAVFDCGDRDLDELIAYGKANNLPLVEKNGIIYLDPREWGGFGDYIPDMLSAGTELSEADGDITVVNGTITKYNRTDLTDIIIPEGITGIGEQAFDSHKEIKTVQFPSTLTVIGERAFAYCYGLTSADLSKTELTTIEEKGFCMCTNLDVPIFPDTLRTIGENAFYACMLGTTRSYGKLVIPAGVVSIGSSAFENNTYLGEVEFKPGSSTITFDENIISENRAFYGSKSLTKITLSNRVPYIPGDFASESKELVTIDGIEDVTSIGPRAFKGCKKLTCIDLSNTKLAKIDQYAFSDCYALDAPIFPETLKEIGDHAFCSTMSEVKNDQSLVIPANVTSLGPNAFERCEKLVSVKFENGDTPIAIVEKPAYAHTFENCDSLKIIELSDRVERIPYHFASDCDELTTVTYPSQLKTVGAWAFSGCKKLKSADFGNTSLAEIEENAFRSCESLDAVKLPVTQDVRIGEFAFLRSGLYGSSGTPGTVTIPENVVSIGDGAFMESKGLGEVIFSPRQKYSTSTDVGNSLFQDDKELTKLVISDRISKITEAFAWGCQKLQYITIPDTVQSIEKRAFYTSMVKNMPVETVLTSTNPVAAAYDWTGSNRKLVDKISGGGGGSTPKPATEEQYEEELKVSGIAFSKSEIVLNIGESKSISADVLPLGTEGQVNITLIPSTQSVLSTFGDASGLTVIGESAGAADIVASVDGTDYTASCHVTVKTSQSDVSAISADAAEKAAKEAESAGSTAGLWIAGIDPEGYTYTGMAVRPDVRVYYGDRLLRAGTEYTISYKNNKTVSVKDKAQIIVTGKGSFGNKHIESFTITACDLSESNDLVSAYAVRNAKGLKTTVAVAGKVLKAAKDYTVKDDNGKVTIEGTAPNFTNRRIITVTDSAPAAIRTAIVTGLTPKAFTGEPIELGDSLKLTDKNAIEIDPGYYTVHYENNQNVGVCSVYITGKTDEKGTGYFGTVKKTFKITPAVFNKDNTTVSAPETALYTKGGAKITPVIEWTSDNGVTRTLREGVDYSVQYKSNTTVDGTAFAIIKGIGAFKGSSLEPISYQVRKSNIGALCGFAPDIKYNASKKGTYYMSAPEIYDIDGKKLALNKDYTVRFVNVTRKTYLNKNSKPAVGDNLRAIVTGKNGYADSTLQINYRVAESANNISKAKIGKVVAREYTGSEVTLTPFPSVTPENNASITEGENGYKVISYYNNVNKGTASVLIAGTGDYSGSKVITFKIIAQKGRDL